MSGIYGIIRPSDVSISDIEMLLHFTPSRDSIGDTTLTKLTTSDVLFKIDNPNKEGISFEGLPGMYTLKLPTTIFGTKGIYTLLIRPIEIRAKIIDTGVLSSNQDIKGVVFDTSTIDANFVSRFENNGLIGYRIEYLDTNTSANDSKISNLFRIVTSNNRAETVNQNLTNTNQKAVRYRFNDNSTLVFCTLSPSSASNVKPNALPFIGQPNQNVIITNTFFNPQMIEIEMVEHDFETIAYSLYGNQSKSISDGIYTIYNFNNQIYKQYDLYEIQDKFTGKPLFEIRSQRNDIDITKNFNDITNV